MKPISINPSSKFLKNRPKMSELIKEHIRSGKTLSDNNYPKGSNEYFEIFKEARSLYSKGVIHIWESQDLELIKNTKLGEFAMVSGSKVPLDFPLMEDLDPYPKIHRLDPIRGKVYEVVLNESLDTRVYGIGCNLLLDKREVDINETLSSIRSLEGVTIVGIDHVDKNYSNEDRHNIDIKLKVDPTPFVSFNKGVFLKILNDMKKLPGVLRARYTSNVKVIKA